MSWSASTAQAHGEARAHSSQCVAEYHRIREIVRTHREPNSPDRGPHDARVISSGTCGHDIEFIDLAVLPPQFACRSDEDSRVEAAVAVALRQFGCPRN